jgi:hypothetical protein
MNLSSGRSIHINDSFGEPTLYENFNNNLDSYVAQTEFASVKYDDVLNTKLKTITEEKIEILEEKLIDSDKKLDEAHEVINNNLNQTKEDILKSTLSPLKIISEKAEKNVEVMKQSIEKVSENNNNSIKKISDENLAIKRMAIDNLSALDDLKSSISSLENSFNDIKKIESQINTNDKKTTKNSLRIINNETELNNIKESVEGFKPYMLNTVKSEVKDYVEKYEESKPAIILQIMNESMNYFSEGLLITEDKLKENSILLIIVVAVIVYIIYNLFIESKNSYMKKSSPKNILEGGADFLNYLSTISTDSFDL